MKELARHGGARGGIDLFFSVKSPGEASIAPLRRLAGAAGVAPHVVDSDRTVSSMRANCAPLCRRGRMPRCGSAGRRVSQGAAAGVELFEMR
jgi:hypothetical protein